MKRILLLLAAGALLAIAAWAQYYPLPPVHVPFCHDENICTGVYGCRWITICQ